MANTKCTIKDIARLAGVSKGTVDRVLHNRGKVSKRAAEKVERILKEIDYQPNPIAQNLKNNKVYRINVLMPSANDDPYWAPAHYGILEAAKEFKPFGIIVDEFFYYPNDETSFLEKSMEALDPSPDALLMAPLFQKEAEITFKKCQELNIPVALFDNYIKSLKGKIFIGQDLYQSGRVAASLIDKIIDRDARISIVHINLEPHMELKEKGFIDYFEQKGGRHLITTYSFNTESSVDFENDTSIFFKENPTISAMFVTNSKTYRLKRVLERTGKKIIVVGYDLLEQNIKCLKEGTIDFLIHQKPKQQAYLGVGYLAEHFLFGKEIPAQDLLPIDIITSENVQYYLK
ncbi:MAG: LacI family transcriptional regulator [Maribacter sp.]|nr:MAG: LacI family transcriptional regulator [Maribacter sp.]